MRSAPIGARVNSSFRTDSPCAFPPRRAPRRYSRPLLDRACLEGGGHRMYWFGRLVRYFVPRLLTARTHAVPSPDARCREPPGVSVERQRVSRRHLTARGALALSPSWMWPHFVNSRCSATVVCGPPQVRRLPILAPGGCSGAGHLFSGARTMRFPPCGVRRGMVFRFRLEALPRTTATILPWHPVQ